MFQFSHMFAFYELFVFKTGHRK